MTYGRTKFVVSIVFEDDGIATYEIGREVS